MPLCENCTYGYWGFSAILLKQSILPPSTAVIPALKEWVTSWVRSRAGRSRTVCPEQVLPVVAPSAPGNLPNIVSNVRFSLMRNTTCLIFDRAACSCASPGAVAAAPALVGEDAGRSCDA